MPSFGMMMMVMMMMMMLLLIGSCRGMAMPSRKTRQNRAKRLVPKQQQPPTRFVMDGEVVGILSTTTETEMSEDDEDTVVLLQQQQKDALWELAGRTSRRKRQRGRKQQPAETNNRYYHYDTIKTYSKKHTKEIMIVPTIAKEDIESVLIVTATEVKIQLVNGTTFTVNPQTLHQRKDHHVWMSIRTNAAMDLTASELAAVVGNSVFMTRDELLEKKQTGGVTNRTIIINQQACDWGLRMEPRALAQYRQATGHEVEETGLFIQKYETTAAAAADTARGGDNNNNNMVLWLGASPDGLVVDSTDGSLGLLEIKCLWGRRNKPGLPVFDHCPNRFYDQIQGQLAICQREWCDLILYIPPSKMRRGRDVNYRILRVPRNREYWKDTMFPAITTFCNDLKKAAQASAKEEDEP